MNSMWPLEHHVAREVIATCLYTINEHVWQGFCSKFLGFVSFEDMTKKEYCNQEW